MIRYVNLTIAGIVQAVEELVTVEAHGNTFQLGIENFSQKPNIGQTVFIELSVYKTEVKVPQG